MKFKLYSWKKHLKFKIVGILFQFCYFYISLKIRLTNSRYAKKLGIGDDIFNFFRKFRLFDISVKDMRFNFVD